MISPIDAAGADRLRAGDGAGAIGQRRYGLLHVGEVGVAAEGAVALAQDAVEAEVELVLVVGVVAGACVVVGCAAGRRRGEAAEQSERGGVEAGGYGVAGELSPDELAADIGGGRGIVDLADAGKDALTLRQCGDGRDKRTPDERLDALVVAEEEQPVAQDGRAERGSVEVAAVLGAGRGCGRREEVARVQVFVAEELVQAAVEHVGAGARGHVDDSAVEAAELGGHVVGLDGELLDIVDYREEDHLAGLGLQRGDAVEQILVGARTAPVDARQQGAGRKLHARSQLREVDEVARVERDREHRGAGDVGLDVAGLHLQ